MCQSMQYTLAKVFTDAARGRRTTDAQDPASSLLGRQTTKKKKKNVKWYHANKQIWSQVVISLSARSL